jgi:hypothetical protein
MDSLLETAHRNERKQNVFRSVAAIFILLLATVTVWLSADAEARETVLRWVRETFEFGVVYKLESTVEPADTLPEYEITWLPDGLEMVEEIKYKKMYNVHYSDGNGKEVIFEYHIVSNNEEINSVVYFEMKTEYEIVSIGGIEADYYYDEETNGITWIDQDESIFFIIQSNLTKSEVTHVAEGIRKK